MLWVATQENITLHYERPNFKLESISEVQRDVCMDPKFLGPRLNCKLTLNAATQWIDSYRKDPISNYLGGLSDSTHQMLKSTSITTCGNIFQTEYFCVKFQYHRCSMHLKCEYIGRATVTSSSLHLFSIV